MRIAANMHTNSLDRSMESVIDSLIMKYIKDIGVR